MGTTPPSCARRSSLPGVRSGRRRSWRERSRERRVVHGASGRVREGGGTYRWHAGAPDDGAFERAFAESGEYHERLSALDLDPAPPRARRDGVPPRRERSKRSPSRAPAPLGAKVRDEYVVEAYGEELSASARSAREVVVLDADLASDCRVRAFELAYPERFLECGIAEQDMVSTAAGLARHGLLPVVNSFASFLASRANEQIYNQVSEGLEGRRRPPLRRPHSRAGEVASVGPRHLPARGAARRDDRAAGKRSETRALVRWAIEEAAARSRSGSRSVRHRVESRRQGELGSAWDGPPGRRRCGAPRLRAGHAPRGARGVRAPREQRVALAVVDMPWLNRFERGAARGAGLVGDAFRPRGSLARRRPLPMPCASRARRDVSPTGSRAGRRADPAEALRADGSTALARRAHWPRLEPV